jgi:hypothetical protein
MNITVIVETQTFQRTMQKQKIRRDIYKSVLRDTIMKVTNKMQLYRLIYFLCQLYMFRGMFSPIIRSAWLYLQYLVLFTQVAAGWCVGWVETVNTVKRSWWWAKTSPETCRADKE